MYDIVTLGDSKLDVFMDLEGEAHTSCTINREECQLVLRYGEKIPVRATAVMAAGSAMNVALGARKLGRSANVITSFGDDAAWVLGQKTLHQYGITPTYIHIDPKTRSSISTILNFDGESTVLASHGTHTYLIPETLNASWLFIGELGYDAYKLFSRLLRVITPTTRIAWNPGAAQLQELNERFYDFLTRTHTLFVNQQEAERLAGVKHLPLPTLLSTLLELGPSVVVITRGAQGAVAGTRQAQWSIPAYAPTHFVEATGAGDAFASGFLACIASGGTMEDALAWGSTLSASVVEHIGAHEGLLTHEALLARLAESSHYRAARLQS